MKKILMLTMALAAAGWLRAEIPPVDGGNVVGFAEITAPGAVNTIITVPFEACMSAGSPGVLADLVATNGLTAAGSAAAADQLVVLTTSGGAQVYYYYWLQTAVGWTRITTTQLMPDGSEQAITPPEASAFSISRGLGFWIKRVASANPTLYVKGQVSGAKQATEISPGLNLVGYGTVQAFTLNAGIDWNGVSGANGICSTTDRILVGNGDGTYTTYYYYVKLGSLITGKWVLSTPTGPVVPEETPIPAGRGFWYHRRGQGSFTFCPNGK